MKQQASAATGTGLKGKNIIEAKTLYVGIDIHQKDWQVATIGIT